MSNCTPFSGYLSRKSSKGFWQKRWFYLNNQFLIYKKDEITVENKGVLSLHEISSISTTANVLEMVRQNDLLINCTIALFFKLFCGIVLLCYVADHERRHLQVAPAW